MRVGRASGLHGCGKGRGDHTKQNEFAFVHAPQLRSLYSGVEREDDARPRLNATEPALSANRNLDDFDVETPQHLHCYASSTRATLTGDRAGPAVVVLGGISGNRWVSRGSDGGPGWWPGLVGNAAAINTEAFAILGVDYAADESGRTAPTTQEQAEAVLAAMDAAGIASAAIVGASYGGMVALSLAAAYPERVRRLVVISADATPHPMATAIRELQRRVVTLGAANGCGKDALAVARGMAMLSYRTAEEFGGAFRGRDRRTIAAVVERAGRVPARMRRAFVKRMSPRRFLSLSASIDRHCVDPGAIRRLFC